MLWTDLAHLTNAYHQNAELWQRLKDIANKLERSSGQGVPLPRQDSATARSMRCALILASLMRMIDYYIFQPNYVLQVESSFRDDLLREAEKNSAGESYRRAILLSISPEDQVRTLNERVFGVVDATARLVDGIFVGEKGNELRSDLQVFVNQAATTWQHIQQLQDKFETSMRPTEDEGLDWSTFPVEDSERTDNKSLSTSSRNSDRAVLVIFPRLYMVKDAKPKPVTSGIVLMKSQTVGAAQEVRSEAESESTFGRGPFEGTRRRDSLLMNDSMANRRAATFLGPVTTNGQSR